MYFGYEQDFAGRWCPVVYHHKPRVKNGHLDGANGLGPAVSGFIEVPKDFISQDGPVLIDGLVAKYPPPAEVQAA